jgi:hypothetical protein
VIFERISADNEVFPRVVKLRLVGSDHFPSNELLFALDYIQDLTLYRYIWNDSSNIPLFCGLRTLTLSYCDGFTTLSRLPASLGYLKIIGVSRVDSLTIPCKDESSFPLYDLIIENCNFLKELQIDEKCSNVKSLTPTS